MQTASRDRGGSEVSSDHHSTTAPQGDTTITVPAPDPLEPLREAVTAHRMNTLEMQIKAIEREAARLVLRELEQIHLADDGYFTKQRIAYWRSRT